MSPPTAADIIRKLNLKPHPEGSHRYAAARRLDRTVANLVMPAKAGIQ